MSEWTPPPESSEYRTPRDGLGVLKAELLRLSRRIAALEGAAPLRQAGITVTPDGLIADRSVAVHGDLSSTGSADITGTTHIGGATTIDGSTTIDDTLHITGDTDIDGTLTVDATTTLGGATTISGDTDVSGTLDVTGDTALDGDTSVGGALTVTGPATIGGTLGLGGSGTVTGTLQSADYVAGVSGWRLTSAGLEVNAITVKGGILDPEALAHETRGASATGTAAPNLAGSPTAYAAASVTVPAGFTQASAVAMSTISLGTNALTGSIATRIAGDVGQTVDIPITTSGLGAAASAHARTWAVVGGSTITAHTIAGRDGGSGSHPAAITTVLSVTFYR